MSFEIFGVIILTIAFIVILLAYDRSLRLIERLKKEKQNAELHYRQEAERIIQEAKDKALRILTKAEVDSGRVKDLLEERIDELVTEQVKEYKENIHNISNSIKEDVKNEASQFKAILEMETVGTERRAAKHLQDEYAKVELEVAEFKDQEIKRIKSEIAAVLEKAVRQQLPKAINIEGHTEIIIQALEEYKSQNDL